MPTVTDIVALAEALEKSPVIIAGDRCVHVRNRNASCDRCLVACTRDAITVRGNDIALDASACCGCGACVAACPTEALVPVQADDEALFGAAVESAAQNGGTAVIACARMAAKKLADPGRIAEVPCLARIDEALVVRLAAAGASEVMLVDGTCATCKHRDCVATLDYETERIRELLAAFGCETSVRRCSEFPPSVLLEDVTGHFGSSRRGFFSDAVNATKETALTAARATIDKNLGISEVPKAIGERLRVTESGSLPRLDMPRHVNAIDALDVLAERGLPDLLDDGLAADRAGGASPFAKTRLFGNVSIDVDHCSACGMCAVFCPACALVRDPAEKPGAPVSYLEFTASSCVQCRLCADVCYKRCLVVGDAVPLAQLFDFEPVVFWL